ncbi:hypothetical protein GLOIN_2v1767181 [Rhizophagus irregularis DAOM 181602=DAOM 197198]|nr:hypothetical protein GLOIN_2v1767181 [Rhizophagus irregularis DAOM 181602=DAOM 197198]
MTNLSILSSTTLVQYLRIRGFRRISNKEFNKSNKSNESDEIVEPETIKIFKKIIKADIKKLKYDVKIAKIERIRKFGITTRIITTYKFIKKYLGIWNLKDKELDKQLLQAYTNAIYEHDIGTDWNNLALLLITLTGLQEEVQVNINAIGNLYANRGTIMEIPVFYRTREKDPEEWINKFEKTFTANGLENDDVQRFRIAKARLIREVSD